MTDVVLYLTTTDAREACKNEADLTERIKKAMRCTASHYMATDEDLCFRAALAGALMESPDEDKARLIRSVGAIRAVSDMLSGRLCADTALEVLEKAGDVLPLVKYWNEIRHPGKVVT